MLELSNRVYICFLILCAIVERETRRAPAEDKVVMYVAKITVGRYT